MATLTTGARLGPYAVLEQIGQGGMGEVYRATDTRLDRIVAIKVLPAHVADSPMRRQRFEREARAVSSLNDPHICALYDVGEQDASPFLVMEYVEGETLARRLMRGALPIDQTLRYAIEIADALDHAHRQGIVHRDLKPANIMLTRTGIKLLDFGVAKMWSPDPLAGHSITATRPADTITEEGTIVGTLHYMAPEQLEGRDTDARTDIFAFGAVVYEMATGQPAFQGQSQASVIAAILEREPARLSAARAEAPPLFDQIITRCLAKKPDDRWQTAADLKQALTWAASAASGTMTGAVRALPQASTPTRAVWIAAVILLAIASVAAMLIVSTRTRSNTTPYRFEVFPPEHATFNPAPTFMSISPDGRYLAFIATSRDGNAGLWIRALDSVVSRLLPGTDGAYQPYWSPDSRFIAFGVGGQKFYKVDVTGGAPQLITDAAGSQMGTWNRDGIIVFKESASAGSGLSRISATGGPVTPATILDGNHGETNHQWPQFLPDGRHFLYLTKSSQPEYDSVVYVGSLDNQPPIRLMRADSQAMYAPPGYLLFMRGETLFAQAFDSDRFRLSGDPIPLPEQVERSPVGTRRAAFYVSQTGVLAYRSVGQTELTWVDRTGKPLRVIGPPGRYSNPALSPDERRLAVGRLDPQTGMPDIWLLDLARDLWSRLTSDPGPDDMPVWSPEGTQIVFRRGGRLYHKAAAGTGTEQELSVSFKAMDQPLDWPRQPRELVYSSVDKTTKNDLMTLAIDGDRSSTGFLRTSFNEFEAQVSPNGRWIAYVSDESGKNDVYVRPFPSGDGKWLISTTGGIEPKWRSDSKELFYLSTDRNLMSVSIRADSTFEPGTPTQLFATRMSVLTNTGFTRNQYVVADNGQRFLINQPPEGPPSAPITVLVNWPAVLKQP